MKRRKKSVGNRPGPAGFAVDRAAASSRLKTLDRTLAKIFGDPSPPGLSDPMDTLVLTILSQNTNDVNRDRAWVSMKARFPVWTDVESAPLEALEDSIRVGGLAAQKAARIKEVLRHFRETTGGYDLTFARHAREEEARALFAGLKGVGPKTLSIVLLFALGMEAFPLDTHCLRILKRLGVLGESTSAERAHEIMGGIVRPGRGMPLHLNLISFGKERCKALKPACAGCPFRRICGFGGKHGEKAR